jgi:glycosyltransferase involved in cell wall biosynthesis
MLVNIPQLSIIVPIYNVELYLEECLNSIYALSDISYEVILVNDGSPDNSAEIIERFKKEHPDSTTVVNRKNGGLSAARNSGLSVAKGQYIAFIDSDDYINSAALLELYQHATNDDLDIVFAQSLTFWGDSRSPAQPLTIPNEVTSLGVTTGLNLLETSFRAHYKRINCWNKIYKRDFLNHHQLHFIDKLLFEDVPFTFEAFFAASRVKAIPIDYYYYRQRPGSIMTSNNQISDNSRIIFINHLLNLFKKNNYNGTAFDDYLVYQLWENATGTGQRHMHLCKTFLTRRKISFRGFVRLVVIMIGLPNLVSF